MFEGKPLREFAAQTWNIFLHTVADQGEPTRPPPPPPPPPVIFGPKPPKLWKGRNKMFESGPPPYLQVWIRHWHICRNGRDWKMVSSLLLERRKLTPRLLNLTSLRRSWQSGRENWERKKNWFSLVWLLVGAMINAKLCCLTSWISRKLHDGVQILKNTNYAMTFFNTLRTI